MQLSQKVLFLLMFMFGFVLSLNVGAQVNSQLDLESLNFISPDYTNTADKNFNFLGMNFTTPKNKNLLFNLDISGMYAFKNSNLSYINLKEIYFDIRLDTSSNLYLGRRLNTWSKLDDEWNLGFNQPQFRWNSLNSESQGLFGLFYEKAYNDFKFLAYGSAVFIPDQGPSYEIQNGEFVGANPFFAQPPREIEFNGVSNPIHYTLSKPETAAVLFQPSYGFQMSYNQETYSGIYSQLSGLYKPSNQFAMQWKGYSVVADYANVEVKPKTYYEKVINLDLGFRYEGFDMALSGIHQNSDKIKIDDGYNGPVFEDYGLVGSEFKYSEKSWSLGLNYFKRLSGSIVDAGPNQDDVSSTFTQKLDFDNAVKVFAEVRLRLFSELNWRSRLSFTTADANAYQQISWLNIFDLKGPLKFLSKLDLVETSDAETVYNYKRNLDQFMIGVQYDL